MHPKLKIELVLSDDVVDLVEQGIDLALRFGVLDDSTMTARHIADSELVLCAAPDCGAAGRNACARAGPIQHP